MKWTRVALWSGLASVVTALPSSNWKRHPLMNEDAMIDATNACDGFKITNPTSGEDVVEGTPNQNVAWDAGVSRIKQVTRIEILDASGRVADYRAGAWNATDGWEMDHELNLTSKTPGQYRYRLSAEAEDGRLCYYQSPYFDLLAPTSSNSTADNTKAAAVAAPVNGTLVTEPSACDGFTITNPTNEETVVEGTPNQNVAWDKGSSSVAEVNQIEILDSQNRVADYRNGPWGATDGWAMDHELDLTNKQPGEYRYKLSTTTTEGHLCVYESSPFYLVAANASSTSTNATGNGCNGFTITNPSPGEKVVEGANNQNVAWDVGTSKVSEITDIEILDSQGRVSDYRKGQWNATDGWEMDHELDLTGKPAGEYRYKLTGTTTDGQTCTFDSGVFNVAATNTTAPAKNDTVVQGAQASQGSSDLFDQMGALLSNTTSPQQGAPAQSTPTTSSDDIFNQIQQAHHGSYGSNSTNDDDKFNRVKDTLKEYVHPSSNSTDEARFNAFVDSLRQAFGH